MTRRIPLFLLGAFLLVYLLPLGWRPLFIPDETRYAEIPREMRASGDWVVPRLNGLRYFEKPVLGYWLTAVAMGVFGEGNFATRFPAAAAAGISALVIFLLARKHAGGPVGAGLAAAVFLLCPLVFGVGIFAVLDGPFSLFITAALALFFFGYMETDHRRKALFFAGFGAASALAFLTKGLLGFALPVIVIVPFMLWERKIKELFRFPWMPLAVALLVVLPWSIMIHLREGDFWNYFIWIEHVRRFFAPVGKSQHPEPFWYFVPVLLGGALPWVFLAPAATAGLRRGGWKNPLVRFCVIWVVLPFLLFSASRGKLGTYILPCFVPLALLLAMGLSRHLENGVSRLFRVGALSLAGLLGLAGLLLIASQTLPVPPDWRFFGGEETAKWILGAAGLFVWALLAAGAARAKSAHRGLAIFCLAPLLFLTSIPFALPSAVRDGSSPESLLLRNAGRIPPGKVVACVPSLVGAVSWHYRRTDVYLAGSMGECTYGLDYEDSGKRYLSLDDLEEKPPPEASPLTLVLPAKTYDAWRPSLPEPVYMDRTVDFVFLQF